MREDWENAETLAGPTLIARLAARLNRRAVVVETNITIQVLQPGRGAFAHRYVRPVPGCQLAVALIAVHVEISHVFTATLRKPRSRVVQRVVVLATTTEEESTAVGPAAL